ncbi:MAG: hybrid sensor histidine kinase/response regulator [Anaerolineales bacterium]|nr:hybrid sensor histidine kinase/response regulator [Anaerolineales bacterium]
MISMHFPDSDSELHDLIRSVGKRVIYTIGGLYLTAHTIATLGFPEIFSPGIWAISIYMFVLVGMSAYLAERKYILSQLLWLVGLAGAILLAYWIYGHASIVLLLVLLPLIAVVTLGGWGALATILFISAIAFTLSGLHAVPTGYGAGILLGGIAVAAFGWSLSSSLLNALDAASYHYYEARRFLAEAQEHRAEISRVLKDRNQMNYQLERLNEMLAFARAQAEEAHENRNRFMLAVSHELRSPLNFIIGFSDLMVNAPHTYAPLEQWPLGLYDDVQEIYNSSKHLMRLINDILDMGKIDASQMTLYRERAQIEQVIADVREMMAGTFERKGLSFSVECPSDLPPVFVDTTRIRQVLINLLTNALRFTDQGGVTLRVQNMDTSLLIEVIDTGTGIAPEDLPRVFDEFRQVGEENWRRHSGTGLGLYISRRFVELHGGHMGVESVPGQGTRFYFTIPYVAATRGTYLPSEPVRLVQESPAILLVTPYLSDADTLKRFLDGYTLHVVESVEQVRQQARELFPRAVLVVADAGSLDPQNLPYDLPVISFSLPRSSPGIRNLYAHLVKPVTRQTLLERIDALGSHVRSLLIVDDDPAMVRFVQQSFRSKSENAYRLLTVFTGKEALELLQHQQVDAILLDLELPDINGWDWLRQIQADEKLAQIPIIVISAQDAPRDAFLPGKNSFELTLRRPLSITEVTSLIKSALENVLPNYSKS